MLSLQKIKQPVAAEMTKFEPYFRATMKSKVPLLSIITNYILRRKGKQMRPLLVFLAAKLTGTISDSTYTAASMIELLHTATLIHDDVVDEAYERRGFFSINALWKSKIAILVGDFLLSKGLLLAVKKKEFELLEIMSEAVREMSEGELLQIEKTRRLDITEDVYFEIIRKKTATLLAACTACGAKSAGNDNQTIEKMRQFGQYAGIAFQIKDDLFDYQKKASIGKPTGNDIKEKKITLPLIYVLNRAKPAERKRLIQIIRRHNKNKAKVKQAIDFVTKNGGIEYARKKMTEYKNKAIAIANEFEPSPSREALIDLVNYITIRKR